MMKQDIDKGRRRFLVAATTLVGTIGTILASIPFLAAWLPSAKAKAAGAPIEVDISNLKPGGILTVQWRGKPVWIINRTKEMLEHLKGHDDRLRDPRSLVDQQPPFADNIYRSLKPEYLILIGICTHLGCTPNFEPFPGEVGANWPGGFYCPCHGSTYDLSGRVFKGVPAPTNLVVPPYRFLDDKTVLIGEEAKYG